MFKKVLIGICLTSAAFGAFARVPFEQYVEQLKTQAQEKGFSEATIERAFLNVKLYESAISADKNQPERRVTLDEYLHRALPKWKVDQARKLYRQHHSDLLRISQYYGVPAEIIVALWGVESNFGKFSGNYDVISSLSTMAYEGRREAFFQAQLFDALTILDMGVIERDNMKGSWAGAMGQSQFMPSSYLAYAADGNGDGKADIWNNAPDVFASAANYLSQVGWQTGYRWGRKVTLPPQFDLELVSSQYDQNKALPEWKSLGVIDGSGTPLPDADIKAWLIEPQEGDFYLVYENYQALLHWNRSHHFVFSVLGLAERIK
ncbi:lytic transglycosylase domain-containing protein [Thaumasiovibrio sp. DFM-14]|uniref:lytic murein transglycosylase n=1 Tax=Thaumasiovibrio sp. DFM-14 TaxID=3384792 RepID=UPI0039A36F67